MILKGQGEWTGHLAWHRPLHRQFWLNLGALCNGNGAKMSQSGKLAGIHLEQEGGTNRGTLQYKELIVFILLETEHTFITEYSHLELVSTKYMLTSKVSE